MAIKQIVLENFTVFEKTKMDFCDGINVFIGENGAGKTHLIKLLYAACRAAQAKKTAIDFPTKVIKVFRPDGASLHRLVRRGVGERNSHVKIFASKSNLSLSFNAKSTKNVIVTGVDKWEKEFSSLSSTFIPAKEILSNSRNLVQAIEAVNVDFDDTYKDIISAASVNISPGPDNERRKKYLKRLQTMMQGRVKISDEEFYLIPTGKSQSKLEFQLVAEGLRKIALLWQLIKNGTLEKGSVLFWDEPEANINPKNIPAIVDLLLDLQGDGVQIFIATHDYFLAKYLDIKREEKNLLRFHSLYKNKNAADRIQHESADEFTSLENNLIVAEQFNIYKEEVKKVLD